MEKNPKEAREGRMEKGEWRAKKGEGSKEKGRRKSEIKGKQYWRVVAGPANSSDVRSKMLQTIQTAGFRDAYFVSN